MLVLGLFCSLLACVFVMSHAENGVEAAAQFGLELTGIAAMYTQFAPYAFAFPPVIWLAAMLVTSAGRRQINIGGMLAILLFGFALLWPMGAFLAFQKAYDPPHIRRPARALQNS
jgi:hypothetical protein